jgi:hypothetical protein
LKRWFQKSILSPWKLNCTHLHTLWQLGGPLPEDGGPTAPEGKTEQLKIGRRSRMNTPDPYLSVRVVAHPIDPRSVSDGVPVNSRRWILGRRQVQEPGRWALHEECRAATAEGLTGRFVAGLSSSNSGAQVTKLETGRMAGAESTIVATKSSAYSIRVRLIKPRNTPWDHQTTTTLVSCQVQVRSRHREGRRSGVDRTGS